MKKKNWANLWRIIELSTQKIVIKFSKYGFGIRDPRFGIRKKPIPFSGSRGQKGTGSRIRNIVPYQYGTVLVGEFSKQTTPVKCRQFNNKEEQLTWPMMPGLPVLSAPHSWLSPSWGQPGSFPPGRIENPGSIPPPPLQRMFHDLHPPSQVANNWKWVLPVINGQGYDFSNGVLDIKEKWSTRINYFRCINMNFYDF